MRGEKSTMRAALLHQAGVVTIAEVPRPAPGPGEVLVRVRAVGICGSDLHFYATGRLGTVSVDAPCILGHEMSGEIAARGEGVPGLAVGQRVVVEPGLACGQCRYCRSGRYNLCPHVRFLGLPPTPGGMAEYVVAPAQWVYPLPDRMSLVEGALMEPLAVALHAVANGAINPESRVVIFGAGPIGLLALQAAIDRGAEQVYIVDVLESRLRLAEKLGATAALNAAAVDAATEVRRLTGGQGAEVAIELSGSPRAVTQAFRAVGRGGTVVPVGLAEDPIVGLEYTNIIRAGIRIETVFRYANLFPLALSLVSRGRVQLGPLTTHTFPFSEAPAAFALAHERKAEVVKAVLLLD